SVSLRATFALSGAEGADEARVAKQSPLGRCFLAIVNFALGGYMRLLRAGSRRLRLDQQPSQ
ncbi:MAG TPA: hypothetical protein VI753_05065, partial [Anaerolineales bacterium]|nr:hypothetical protein [Anaerolineales bacterium]